jgi:hypothetical protein
MSKDLTEVEKVNAYAFALINICRETGAETMTLTQEKVTHKGEPIGDWQIIVRKRGSLSEMEGTIRDVLEKHDGLCMDVPDERMRLADALTKALQE